MIPPFFAFKYKKIARWVKYVQDKETICLTNDQARHFYKKVVLEGIVNVIQLRRK